MNCNTYLLVNTTLICFTALLIVKKKYISQHACLQIFVLQNKCILHYWYMIILHREIYLLLVGSFCLCLNSLATCCCTHLSSDPRIVVYKDSSHYYCYMLTQCEWAFWHHISLLFKSIIISCKCQHFFKCFNCVFC